jgi:hypothetical protein
VQQEAGPRPTTRLVALVVLVVCAWILLKIVLGILAGVSTLIVVVLAIVGVVWALGKF